MVVSRHQRQAVSEHDRGNPSFESEEEQKASRDENDTGDGNQKRRGRDRGRDAAQWRLHEPLDHDVRLDKMTQTRDQEDQAEQAPEGEVGKWVCPNREGYSSASFRRVCIATQRGALLSATRRIRRQVIERW